MIWFIVVNGCRRHIVVAPRTVRPGMVFTLVTQLIDDDIQEASVFATILRDHEVVAQATALVPANTLTPLPIKVTNSINPLRELQNTVEPLISEGRCQNPKKSGSQRRKKIPLKISTTLI